MNLAECAQQWNLTLLPSFPNLSYNDVAPVIRADGTEAVLKVGKPNRECRTEIAALRLYSGRNCVRLLEADAAQGALLLERVSPGIVLTTLAGDADDTRATSIAASLMRGLWRPVPPEHEFPTVADWGQGFARLRARFDGGTGPFPTRLVEQAETLFAELLASSASPVLLHGDLHHDNILTAQRQDWLVIDPKGVVGEAAYEVGALVRNLWEERHTRANPARLLKRRVDQLAEELMIDRARIHGWSFAQAVLSAWWCLEDASDCWSSALEVAELLAKV